MTITNIEGTRRPPYLFIYRTGDKDSLVLQFLHSVYISIDLKNCRIIVYLPYLLYVIHESFPSRTWSLGNMVEPLLLVKLDPKLSIQLKTILHYQSLVLLSILFIRWYPLMSSLLGFHPFTFYVSSLLPFNKLPLVSQVHSHMNSIVYV